MMFLNIVFSIRSATKLLLFWDSAACIVSHKSSQFASIYFAMWLTGNGLNLPIEIFDYTLCTWIAQIFITDHLDFLDNLEMYLGVLNIHLLQKCIMGYCFLFFSLLFYLELSLYKQSVQNTLYDLFQTSSDFIMDTCWCGVLGWFFNLFFRLTLTCTNHTCFRENVYRKQPLLLTVV